MKVLKCKNYFGILVVPVCLHSKRRLSILFAHVSSIPSCSEFWRTLKEVSVHSVELSGLRVKPRIRRCFLVYIMVMIINMIIKIMYKCVKESGKFAPFTMDTTVAVSNEYTQFTCNCFIPFSHSFNFYFADDCNDNHNDNQNNVQMCKRK